MYLVIYEWRGKMKRHFFSIYGAIYLFMGLMSGAIFLKN